jgi:hypothetical protein
MEKFDQTAYSWHGLCCIVNTNHPELVVDLIIVGGILLSLMAIIVVSTWMKT